MGCSEKNKYNSKPNKFQSVGIDFILLQFAAAAGCFSKRTCTGRHDHQTPSMWLWWSSSATATMMIVNFQYFTLPNIWCSCDWCANWLHKIYSRISSAFIFFVFVHCICRWWRNCSMVFRLCVSWHFRKFISMPVIMSSVCLTLRHEWNKIGHLRRANHIIANYKLQIQIIYKHQAKPLIFTQLCERSINAPNAATAPLRIYAFNENWKLFNCIHLQRRQTDSLRCSNLNKLF